MITQAAVTPQLVAWHFLRHFVNMLKLPTVAAHLPIVGSLAPMQAGTMSKVDAVSIAELVEKLASEVAERVNSSAEAVGATHISFEEMDHPLHVDSWHQATDKETGISVRLWSACDIATGDKLTRFDVCYRVWKLLPSKES